MFIAACAQKDLSPVGAASTETLSKMLWKTPKLTPMDLGAK